MNNARPQVPPPTNEPIRDYAPGSDERASLRQRLQEMKETHVEVPAIIGGEEIATGRSEPIRAPHEHSRTLGTMHRCGPGEVERAITAAMEARRDWMNRHWSDRAAVFLKAADLLAGPWRDTLNAATMLGQSKSVHQAEIDAACEMIDFFRFNAYFMQEIYADQPHSPEGVWNRMEYRPLEGFVFAITPFNFTSIQGNLPSAPALMGNVVLWKPSTTSVYSAYFFYKLLEEAGLPPGVINMLPGHGPEIGDPIFASPDFAGLHFTGSEPTFQHLWRTIGENIDRYNTFPRIVGETGGKDFIIAHPSADVEAVSTAVVRGGFEYQGQKCSAASRVYAPRSRWEKIKSHMQDQLDEISIGSPEDFTNYVNAVISQDAFDKITAYIEEAKQKEDVDIIYGGGYSDETGYFIEPTVLEVKDPAYRTMCEEIFGPVVSVYVYEDAEYLDMLDTIDKTSPYALTGAVFARDREAIEEAERRLIDNAGNFYINDKPTGAVVNQQPFGGARRSGTNDKAGSRLNLTRWVSARSIKETFSPPKHFSYPFLKENSEEEYAEAGNGRRY